MRLEVCGMWVPESRAGRNVLLVVALVVLALSGGRRLAVWAAVAAASALSVAVHECGHLIAAKALGYRVSELRIGQGRRVWRRTIGGVVVDIRAFPFSGHVLCGPVGGGWLRTRELVVLAAGAAANVVLVIASIAALPDLWALPIFLTSAMYALCALIPFRWQGEASDGLLILQILLSPVLSRRPA